LVPTTNGVVEGGEQKQLPKFNLIEILFFVKKFSTNDTNLGARNPQRWGNLWPKLEFFASVIAFVGNF